jgi:serine/threonine-protein kinase RsbW
MREVCRNRRRDLEQIQNVVLQKVRQHDYDESSCFAIRLALEEAMANAYKHGNKEDPDKTVTVEYRIDPERVVIRIEDEGAGFDPGTVPDPTVEENLEIPAGRGLMLIRAFMTNVDIDPPGNRLRMTYERPDEQADKAAG